MAREFQGIYDLEYSTDGGGTWNDAGPVEANESQVEFPDLDNDDQDATGGRFPGLQMRVYTIVYMNATAFGAIETEWKNLDKVDFRVTVDNSETHTFAARPQQHKPVDIQGSASEGRADKYQTVIQVAGRDVTEA